VWANADYPRRRPRAREYGAEGIGLCRTEHMFFETDRLPHIQKMIMADYPVERKEALAAPCCPSSGRTLPGCSGSWTACR
jgi:pyruvate,orthophosphate dikinase